MTNALYVGAGLFVFVGFVICLTGAIENRRDADLRACCSTCRARKNATTPAWNCGNRSLSGVVAPLAASGCNREQTARALSGMHAGTTPGSSPLLLVGIDGPGLLAPSHD